MNNIKEAQLLRENREALVQSLNDLGIAADENTPMSELVGLMKWSAGLRDLRLACLSKSTGAYSDYSLDEFNALSASGKAQLVKLGLRIRAERLDFIISKDNIYRSNGNTYMPWASSYVDVRNLTNYGAGSTGHLLDVDGEANTDAILAFGETANVTFEAAQQARAYKASTVADGGYDDPTKWSLPAIGQLWLLYKYKKEINAALTSFFGTSQLISDDWYWSSTEYDASYAWSVYMAYGYVYGNSKNLSSRVRAVAPVPVVSVSAAI